jgi:large subunit ribosomal protein L1
MPTPKAGTVTFDVGRAVSEIKAGKIEFRVDKTGNVHAPIGRVSFDVGQLADNLGAFMDSIVRARPAAAKGTYVQSVTVASTMGPGRGRGPEPVPPEGLMKRTDKESFVAEFTERVRSRRSST